MKTAMDSEVVRKGSLQADGHFGFSIPIGGVIAADNAVIPAGAGFDIGCGMRVSKLNLQFSEIEADLKRYLYAMQTAIPIGLGKQHSRPVEHEIFDRDEWNEEPFKSIRNKDGLLIKDIARSQLGTCGSGNH